MLTCIRACSALAIALFITTLLTPAQTTHKQATHGKSAVATQTYAWVTQPSMTTAREQAAAAVLNGKLYVTGGINISYLRSVEVYDPASGRWAAAPDLPTMRGNHAAAVLNGKLYVLGGHTGNGPVNTVDAYDPMTNTWTTAASFPTPRAEVAAAVLGGKLYLLGGRDGNGFPLKTVEVYDPAADMWMSAPAMPTARAGLGAAVLGDKLYAIGGDATPSYLATVEVFDPVSNSWSVAAPMTTPRNSLAVAALNNKLYALGGSGRDGISHTMEVYDPATNVWSLAPAPPTARVEQAAAVLNNSIYVVAGSGGINNILNTMDAFTPLANPGDVLISEFRFKGANTAQPDQFIELYNNTDAPLVVADAAPNAQRDGDSAQGWAVFSDYDMTNEPGGPLVWFVIPAGTLIPARGHYLITTPGYSLGAYPAGNGTTATGDQVVPAQPAVRSVALQTTSGYRLTAGPPLTRYFLGVQLDSAAFATPPFTYFGEGTRLQPVNGLTTNGEYSFVRRLTSGVPQDTNDNAQDFVFVSIDGGMYDGVQSILGAPSPENTASPVQRNAQLKVAVVDPQQPSTAAPNRVRDFAPTTNGALGTLALRRKFTNKTGAPVTALRFRITDITTATAPAGTADLRALAGQSGSFNIVLTSGAPVPVQRLMLEQPPTQTQGGGLHASLAVSTITLATPLAPNASLNVEFLLGVQTGGSFRFFINVEALP